MAWEDARISLRIDRLICFDPTIYLKGKQDIMEFPVLNIPLPNWIEEFLLEKSVLFPTIEDRMHLVIELSRRNVAEHTGGPF
jgi:hypothetical protein